MRCRVCLVGLSKAVAMRVSVGKSQINQPNRFDVHPRFCPKLLLTNAVLTAGPELLLPVVELMFS